MVSGQELRTTDVNRKITAELGGLGTLPTQYLLQQRGLRSR